MNNRNITSATTVEVAGIRVDLAPRSAVINQLREAMDGTKPLCVVNTLNPEILMQAFNSLEYANILNAGTLNVVDGVGLKLAMTRRPTFEIERICGSDLIFDLAEMAECAQRPLLLLGGLPMRLKKAKFALSNRYPDLKIETLSPGFSPTLPLPEQTQIADLLRSTRPGVVAVFLGAPRQETWIAQNRDLLVSCDVRIATGLGGTIDFLSGEVVRAPKWIRAVGFEWAFRLAQEPKRLRRQLSSLPEFALRAIFDRRFINLTPTTGGDHS